MINAFSVDFGICDSKMELSYATSSFIAKVDRMRLLCGSVHFVCFPS